LRIVENPLSKLSLDQRDKNNKKNIAITLNILPLMIYNKAMLTGK
jgi:hypothetical protein